MANTTRDISNICRFCLCQQHGFNFVSSLFTIKDIEHFTGIQITAEEQLSFAMCVKCCKVLENSVAFRSSCLDNDIIYKQLVSGLAKSVKDDLEEHEETAQIKSEPLDVANDERINEEHPKFNGILVATEIEDTGQITAESNIQNCPNGTQRSQQKRKHRTTDDVCSTTRTPNPTNAAPPDDKIKKRSSMPREMELCAICGKMVSCIYKHVANQHAKEKTFTCPHCQIEMKNRSNMMRHINAVHKKKVVKSCEQCGKGFMHKNSYLSHMQSQHGIGDTFECKVCAKTFKLAAYYRAHMRVWHSTKEYPCTSCAMVFNKRKSLTIHQRVHSTDQPYACHQCPKRFKSSYARKTHELTHSGIRFQCTICDKSYRYKSLLSMHYRKDHEDGTPKETND